MVTLSADEARRVTDVHQAQQPIIMQHLNLIEPFPISASNAIEPSTLLSSSSMCQWKGDGPRGSLG